MSPLSRRMFLQESLLAASALAVPAGTAEPAPAQPAEKPSRSAAERLSVAVIGVRGRGAQHARTFAERDDCVLSYVCDADSAVGERVASRFEGRPKFVQDMRRVFDDKSVDVVSIATPNHWHALAAIWAMQAGKDVYVEKPVSHNVSEGRRMVQAARKYGRICQAGTQYRSSGAYAAAARFVRSGKLGQVRLVRVCTYRARGSIGPAGENEAPATVDYDLWAGPAPIELPLRRKAFHYDWHWFWDWGGGELANNSIHSVDTARFITGLQGLGRGVISYGGRVGLEDCGETPSVQVSIHDFGDTTLVQEVRNLKTDRPPRGSLLVVGTEGYLAGTSVYDAQGKLVEKLSGPGGDHFDNFIRAVRSRRREELNADIEEGHTSTAVVHVANVSQRLGAYGSPAQIRHALECLKCHGDAVEAFEAISAHLADNGVDVASTPLKLGPWLEIDPDKETFVGNAAADALLTREYRRPFAVPTENAL